MLSAVWHDPPGSRFRRIPWLGRFMDRVERGIEWLHALYGTILEWALGHRKSVIALALVSFFASFGIVPLVGTEFIPDADEGFISLRLNTPVGSSLEYTDSKVRQVEAMLKGIPEIALAMTTVGSDEGRNYARINLKLVDLADREALAEGDRTRDQERAQAHSRRRARVRLQPADLRQSARARPRDAHEADRRIRAEGCADSRHRRPGDVREGRRSRIVDPAQQRRRGGCRNHGAAGGRDASAAACRRHRELLAGAGRAELRGERAAAEGEPPACVRPRQSLSRYEQARPRRRGADGAAAPGCGDRRDDVARRSSSARNCSAASRSMPMSRDVLPAMSARTCRRSSRSRRCRPATVSMSAARRRTCRNRSRRRSRHWASP